MGEKGKLRFLNKTWFQIAGTLLILLLAALLLWLGNVNSNSATNALMAQVRFEGEYRIADGPWQKIVEGEHISSTQGDVTLRGQFHTLTPDGEYVGVFTGDMPIAIYTDHISVTVCEGENEPYVFDTESPWYGDSVCGVGWNAYSSTSGGEAPMEIRIHNPHSFGNETAIDEMLANTAFWAGIDFEKGVLQSGEAQRNTGLFFIIVSLVLLGIALFSSLIHIKNSKLLWLFGLVNVFAGIYFIYSAGGISFWSDSVVSNTIVLGLAMIFYMLFLAMVIVYFLETTQKLGSITVMCLGVVDGAFFIVPMVTELCFYDTWLWWAVAQGAANLVLMGCLVKECFRKQSNWIYICAMLPLIAFGLDATMTGLGLHKGGVVSRYVFMLLFGIAVIVVLQIIPRGINAAAKAKELETEKTALNAQLAETRISTMMSQIRPHFIYNTLGSIEQLCEIDPAKAGELVHNFAKYLRGNFGELDNPRPIQVSQEMEHVQYYISIEKVRFPDMTFLVEMDSVDFRLPALSIQPIVENAVKHGLMKREKGGTIRVRTYETDTHYCVSVEDDGVGFDIGAWQEDRAHMGIRNIRERLKAMVGGTIEIESTVGVGTKALICIPKEDKK